MIVLFGHQSVGQNLLDGIRELARNGVRVPPLLSLHDLESVGSPMAVRAFRVGQNRDPLGKFQHFSEVATGELGARADVAMIKLCYVDIEDEVSVGPLADAYFNLVRNIQSRRPALVVAHVTVPLQSRSHGPLAGVRRVFGRVDPGAASNAARATFNEQLRARFAFSNDLFDLAAIESRASEERPCTMRGKSGRVPALSLAYTNDGGHLNESGRRVVAGEFLGFLDQLQTRHGIS